MLSSKTSKGSTNKRTSSSDDTQFWVGLQEEKKRGERQQNGLQTDKQEPPDALQETKEAPDQVDVEGKHPFISTLSSVSDEIDGQKY